MRRSSQANITDSSMDAGHGIVVSVCDENENHRWDAFYVSPWGYVQMEARRWATSADTWLIFIWQERTYMRHFDRFYSRRYAMRLAREFVWEVVEGKVDA